LFYSFAKPGVDYLLLEDIAKYFATPEDAEAAWNLFDRDGNGDATRDEVEMTCMYVLGPTPSFAFERGEREGAHAMSSIGNVTGNSFLSNTLCGTLIARLADWITSSCRFM
jgi:hypothetical protein